MRPTIAALAVISLVLLALAVGCAGTSSQLSSCQQEKEQLLAAIRSQREANKALAGQVASLESRLDQAEKELARTGAGTRLSSRPLPPAPSGKPDKPEQPAPKALPSESLPWRAPPGKTVANPQAPEVPPPSTSQRRAAAAALLALARRDSRVRYDAATRAAQIDVALSFEGPTATLTAADKRRLDDLAKLLKSNEARELRIMVAGHTADEPPAAGQTPGQGATFTPARQLAAARAQAVADYLDRHGIARERLAVSSSPARAVDTTEPGGVQVFLLDPDTSVADWQRRHEAIRR